MNSGIKKRLLLWAMIAVATTSCCFAAPLPNEIMDIRFIETSNGIIADIITEKATTTPVRAVKSGEYYNIILPNFDKGKYSTFATNDLIESVRVSSVPASANGEGYTKIQIKVTNGVNVTAKTTLITQEIKDQIAQKDSLLGRNNSSIEDSTSYEDDSEEYYEEEYYEEDDEPTTTQAVSKTPSSTTSTYSQPTQQQSPQFTPPPMPEKDNSHEILLWLIGGGFVFLLVVLLYIKGRNEMNSLCGDMDVDFSPEEKKKKKDSKKSSAKKKTQSTKRSYIDFDNVDADIARSVPSGAPQNKPPGAYEEDDDTHTIVDIDSIYSSQASSTPTVEPKHHEEDYDVDDFLSSFVDEDDNSQQYETEEPPQVFGNSNSSEQVIESDTKDNDEEETSPELENPIDSLVDEVLSTQEMNFSEEDFENIQKKLQADLSEELLDNITETKTTKQKEEKTAKSSHTPMTLKDFDKIYPDFSDEKIKELLKSKPKFNDIDKKVITDLMTAIEMSEDAILEAKLRRDLQEEENINYYESEQDFAFTLIKTEDVQNLDELVVLDNNLYPDLDNTDFSGDAIFEEFSLIKPDIPSDEAPSIEDIENAMNNIELISMTEEEAAQYPQKPEPEIKDYSDDPILSEFHLIQPEVQKTEVDEHFTKTVFTSMEDIGAQFRALGIDFDDTQQTTQPPEESVSQTVATNPIENTTVSTDTISLEPEVSTTEEPPTQTSNTGMTTPNFEETDVYAKYKINDTTELFISYYQGQTSLLAMKNGAISKLYDFEDGEIPSSISAREAETTETGTRYIVRANKYKFVIETGSNDIKMVMAL